MKKTQTVKILEIKILECTLDIQRQSSPREYRDRRQISSTEEKNRRDRYISQKMLNLILPVRTYPENT